MQDLGLVDDHLVAEDERLITRQQVPSDLIDVNERPGLRLIVLALLLNALVPALIELLLVVLLALLPAQLVLPVVGELLMHHD